MTRNSLPLLVLLAIGCSSSNDETVGDYVIQPYQNTPPEQSVPGQVFEDVTIRVLNRDSDPLGNLTVTFTGDGTIEPDSAVTNGNGIVTLRWALPATPIEGVSNPMTTGAAGEYNLIASVGAEVLTITTSAHALKVDQVDAGFGHACGIVAGALVLGHRPGTGRRCRPARIRHSGPSPPSGGHRCGSQRSTPCVLNATGLPLQRKVTGNQFTTVTGARRNS
jgi:hypothetical protein